MVLKIFPIRKVGFLLFLSGGSWDGELTVTLIVLVEKPFGYTLMKCFLRQ